MKTAEPISQQPLVDDAESTGNAASFIDDDDDAREPEWKQRAQEGLLAARAWVRENPLPAIGIAVATGFVVGRIFRR